LRQPLALGRGGFLPRTRELALKHRHLGRLQSKGARLIQPALLFHRTACGGRIAGLVQIRGDQLVRHALRVGIGGRHGLQLQHVGLGAVLRTGESALADTVLNQHREALHLRVLLAAGDICAPARDLLRGYGGRLLCLAHVLSGTLQVAIAQRSRDLPRIQTLLECADPCIVGSGGLEVGERLRGFIEASSAQRLIQAPPEHGGDPLQAVAGLTVRGISRGGRAVVEQGIVANGLGEAPLVHRKPRLLE
jgi:hypothetical protein